jgi:hypothetical protein
MFSPILNADISAVVEPDPHDRRRDRISRDPNRRYHPSATAALALIFCGAVAADPAGAVGPVRPDVFEVTSPDFADNGLLSWTNAPPSTKSFAILMFDPDGAIGMGSIHWVVYGIAPSVSGLARGEGSKPSAKFVGGANDRNLATYFGPCPEPGDLPHHYVIQVYALDLAPGELPPGLTRDAFMQKIHGHAVAEASIIGRY